MDDNWFHLLQETVRQRGLVVIQLDENEHYRLQESYFGMTQFTIARFRDTLAKLQTPTACLILCEGFLDIHARFGLASTRSRVSTLDSRVKVNRAQPISPSSKDEILELITDKRFATSFRHSLETDDSVVVLPSALSAHLVEKLAEIESNRGPMRFVSESLSSKGRSRGMASLQRDALHTALGVFGLSPDYPAHVRDTVKGQESALESVSVVEDSVIEHDARDLPGFNLIDSDVTGRAVFKKGAEILEIYTANRRPLEKVLGVDLIYLNAIRQNIVMLQYKMLERKKIGGRYDWIYRPDDLLESEIERMQRFQQRSTPGQYEYRLNSQVFYLRFVKREGPKKRPSITMPIEHFERLRTDPSCRGPRGAFRISFQSLAGRYLRQTAFVDLVRSGYIGAHADTTQHLTELVRAVARGDKAIVAAIQSHRQDIDAVV